MKMEDVIEHCARIAECAFDDRPHMGHDFRWHDGLEAGCKAAAAAIRAQLPIPIINP